MDHLAIQRDRFHRAVRLFQNGAAGGFIHAAALHAHETIFQQVDPANAMFAAQLVEFGQKGRRRQAFAVDGHRIALFERNFQIFRFVGSLFRADRQHKHLLLRFGPGIFQNSPFERNMQQVAVAAPRALFAHRHFNVVLARILDQIFAALEIPFPPRRYHPDGGIKRIVAQFEADLIVPLAGCAVRNRIGAFGRGDLHLTFCNKRPGDGRSQEIAPLVERIGAEHGKHEIPHKFFLQILDEALARPGTGGLVRNMSQLFALPHIGGESDNLAAIALNEPAQDNGCIQTAGIRQHDFFDFLLPRTRHMSHLLLQDLKN